MNCYACGSDKSSIDKRRSQERWFYNGDNDRHAICNRCYHRLFYAENGRQSAKRSNLKRKGKRLRFKDKEIRLQSPIRINVCNFCRAVVPFDSPRTHMHHEQYDELDPLNHIIELCLSCHNKRSRELGQIVTIYNPTTRRFT